MQASLLINVDGKKGGMDGVYNYTHSKYETEQKTVLWSFFRQVDFRFTYILGKGLWNVEKSDEIWGLCFALFRRNSHLLYASTIETG